MAGLVHGHAAGFLAGYRDPKEVELVGIAEPDPEVAEPYVKNSGLDPRRSILRSRGCSKRPAEAVVAFTSTADHPAVVAAGKAQAPGDDGEAAGRQRRAGPRDPARGRRGRHPGTRELRDDLVSGQPPRLHRGQGQKAMGAIRKVVVHAGHRGPKEIGVQPEFLEWLTDPAGNGAGALFDFGCDGANLMTWLMDDARPMAVTAVTQRIKPEVYARVDDEATIVLEYPGPGDRPGVVELAVRPQGHGDLWPDRPGPDCRPGWVAGPPAGKPEEPRQAPPLTPGDDFFHYSPPSCAAGTTFGSVVGGK